MNETPEERMRAPQPLRGNGHADAEAGKVAAGGPVGGSAAGGADSGRYLKPSGRVSAAAAAAAGAAPAESQAVSNAVFVCRDVNVFYGAKQALKDVSVDVGQRQVLAMIGPSGCGKSTFLRCLNRMNDTIPGARVDGATSGSTDRTSTIRRSTWCSCARASAWCSRSPTRSRSRSTKTSPTARASTAWPRAARIWMRSCARV